MHALWIEWRQQTLQTTAMLALAGVQDKVEPDSHAAFAELFGETRATPRRALTPEDREERMRLVAALSSVG